MSQDQMCLWVLRPKLLVLVLVFVSRGPDYKISYDLSQHRLKFIIRST